LHRFTNIGVSVKEPVPAVIEGMAFGAGGHFAGVDTGRVGIVGVEFGQIPPSVDIASASGFCGHLHSILLAAKKQAKGAPQKNGGGSNQPSEISVAFFLGLRMRVLHRVRNLAWSQQGENAEGRTLRTYFLRVPVSRRDPESVPVWHRPPLLPLLALSPNLGRLAPPFKARRTDGGSSPKVRRYSGTKMASGHRH
jgi:hypothetical protein